MLTLTPFSSFSLLLEEEQERQKEWFVNVLKCHNGFMEDAKGWLSEMGRQTSRTIAQMMLPYLYHKNSSNGMNSYLEREQRKIKTLSAEAKAFVPGTNSLILGQPNSHFLGTKPQVENVIQPPQPQPASSRSHRTSRYSTITSTVSAQESSIGNMGDKQQ